MATAPETPGPSPTRRAGSAFDDVHRQAAARSSKRRIQRTHKKGSLHFVVLVLVLLATAALVTVAMFRALYILLG